MKKITNKELTDMGICPTCYDREHNHIVFGDNKNQMLYENKDIECYLCGNPRARGHTIISTKKHYKDMLELPETVCKYVYVFAQKVMIILKDVYQAESIYLCTMCDGPMNHFHIQLIPRYKDEKRGSTNFIKPRKEYIEDKDKINKIRKKLNWSPETNIKKLVRVEEIDIDEYLKFRKKITGTMSNPDWLGDFSKDDLERMLKEDSKIWMYYQDMIPVCSMMLIPTTKRDLEKFNLAYKETEVVDYGPMFVDPIYRGNKLQYQMLKELDEIAKIKNYKYAITTVHPDNVYSIKNLEKDKFKLIGTKTFTRGKRNIYLKKYLDS